MTKQNFLAQLARARKQGLIETTGRHEEAETRDGSGLLKYKFCHDKVQQAFYVSVVDSDALLIHRAIGLYLWDERGETVAIEVADHLMRTEPLAVASSLLLEVNYAAARMARTRKSYPLSVKYLKNALELLGPDKWTGHYNRSLEMSTLLIELFMACGKSAEVEAIVSEVSKHARCLEDKLPVMLCKVVFFGSLCRYAEAIEYARFLVRLCGKSVPRNLGLLQIVWKLSAVRRVAARLTDDDIMKLPTVTDKKS